MGIWTSGAGGEIPELRAIDGHKFVARLGPVRLDARIRWNVFSQTEDRIDSQKMFLIVILAFPRE